MSANGPLPRLRGSVSFRLGTRPFEKRRDGEKKVPARRRCGSRVGGDRCPTFASHIFRVFPFPYIARIAASSPFCILLTLLFLSLMPSYSELCNSCRGFVPQLTSATTFDRRDNCPRGTIHRSHAESISRRYDGSYKWIAQMDRVDRGRNQRATRFALKQVKTRGNWLVFEIISNQSSK